MACPSKDFCANSPEICLCNTPPNAPPKPAWLASDEPDPPPLTAAEALALATVYLASAIALIAGLYVIYQLFNHD